MVYCMVRPGWYTKGFGQVGFDQAGFGQVGFGQVGFDQVGFGQVGCWAGLAGMVTRSIDGVFIG